ncbi:tyrosine-type recombinase/integrase [Paraconexibacter antarcticus]|uniref:Tyrosine-type recombinase/integrase n=1 Tax=Paraconexibacter antarcticus TaxID=2949664 RepID=A0ABY5DQE8_9ACTN|nr:site-specific integrase [Paraconexibacter antarcticus]UTI63896.1 tyrosine-type recombinase/integrase [Paraconexibacter antarcticus]
MKPRRGRPRAQPGLARAISPTPVRNAHGRVVEWRAQYRDGDNIKRRAGNYRTKTEAHRATEDRVAELNKGLSPDGGLTLGDWMSIWPARVGRDPRTVKTHQARIEAYVYPHLPGGEDRPLETIKRRHVHDIQTALLAKGLSKTTIDGAIASLSAVLGYALREHRIDVNPALGSRVDPADTRLQPTRKRVERRWIPPSEAGKLLEAVAPRHWALVLTPFLTGVRPEELLALRAADIDSERELILVHQRAAPAGGRSDKPGTLKPGLKERRRLIREEPEIRGRWVLFPKVLHPDRTGHAIPGARGTNVLQLNRSEFLYTTTRTRGSRTETLAAEQKLQGSIWSQRNLYRDVIEPAREAAGMAFTLYDARHTFVSTLMAAGIPVPEVAAYSGHSVGELAAVADGDKRLRNQTTLAVYTHATGQAREDALAAINGYLTELLAAAPSLRTAIA